MLDFKVGYMSDKYSEPLEYVPAKVPGNAQLDIAGAENYPDYNFGDNFKQFAWMEDVYFKYRAIIRKTENQKDELVYLKSAGIDYEYSILIDGTEIFYHEGMFTPLKLDITKLIKEESTLDIIIYPAPKAKGRKRDRSEADESVKPPVSYEWDWHPRLIPCGLYENVYIEILPKLHIDDAELTYTLTDDLCRADIHLHTDLVNADEDDGSVMWELFDRDNRLVKKFTFSFSNDETSVDADVVLDKPTLWWCNKQGDQYLYTSVFTLINSNGKVIERKSGKVGFRRVKLVPSPFEQDGTSGFPKTRNLPPITVELNNRRIFALGSNWLAPEIFIGTIDRSTYEPQVKLAAEANFNMFRSWGGSMISKESFFDCCDEYGIMVWQEFPLSCNDYKGPPRYMKVLDAESKSIIKRVRRHACLALWCGGNELFNSWSGMNDQYHALRLLNANTYSMDMNTPFIPTSPIYGMGHGSYVFRYNDGYDCITAMVNSTKTAYTEFGNPGISSVEELKKMIPQNEIFPPVPESNWTAHHGFAAWQPDSWLHLPTFEYYFGTIGDNIDELVAYSQMLQCIGYMGIFEESRRQWPKSSMALNWCYNEPWPCAVNNSLLMYKGKPKPAYYSVAKSCRPSLASGRVKKFDFTAGETFEVEPFILNNTNETLPNGKIKITLEPPEKTIELGVWEYNDTYSLKNQKGPVFSCVLDMKENCLMRLKLTVENDDSMSSEYLYLYKNPASTRKILPESL